MADKSPIVNYGGKKKEMAATDKVPSTNIQDNLRSGSIVYNGDGAGVVLTTGVKGYFTATFAGTITGWYIISDVSGSAVVDVWKRAGAIPNVSHSIAGTEKPTLSSAQMNSDTSLSTWTDTAVAVGDVIAFNIDSISTITNLKVILVIQKT